MIQLLFTILCFIPGSLWAVETIILTQTACQFVEAEQGDKHYQANSYAACKTFNAKTGHKRLEASKPLHLKAGEICFSCV